jgi:catechol 2,3-dioxygenase-like lactoylglutathione lyase family enzyme
MTVDILVNIDVGDLEKAVAFYCEALGLRVGRRFGNEVVELLGAAAPIYLLEKPARSTAAATTRQRRSYGRHWTPVHLDVVVPDIAAALARAEAAGARRESDVQVNAWGSIAAFADPFGHGFCLIQFHGRGYDEIAEAGEPAA